MTGTSGTLLDHHARDFLARASDVRAVLDIGAGRGKYGLMARMLCPDARLTAVEIDAGYVEAFGLHEIYDHVMTMPAAHLMTDPIATWDMVIMGDVIEHMRKSEGVDLLHFLIYRTRYLWVQWPMRYIQGPLEGHTSEAHVSVWTERDIQALNADYVKFEQVPLEAYAVNGYPNAGRHIYEVMEVFPHG